MVALATSAQDWEEDGNTSTNPAVDFLGTDDNNELTIRTDDAWRLQVNKTESYNIDAFSLMPADGFVGISPDDAFWTTAPYGPFSRLHLAEGREYNAQTIGYRPWMRNGINFTGNNDQMYIGQKYTYDDAEDHTSGELLDFTDAVIQWSDNPGTWLSDRMRFIFTSDYNSDPTGNGSLEGLEAMQLYPHDDGSEVFVGIGDWFAAGVSPSERLDVLDRTIRIRKLVDDYEDDGLDKIVVTDDDGLLHWRPLSSLDCKWTMSGTSPNHVVTALGNPSGTCPDREENVGIGQPSPTAKLDVYDFSPDAGDDITGIRSKVENATDVSTGVDVLIQTGTGTNRIGVKSITNDGDALNHGLDGRAFLTVTQNTSVDQRGNRGVTGYAGTVAGVTFRNYGVEGQAHVSDAGTVDQNFGVRGYATMESGTSVDMNVGVYGYANGHDVDFGIYGLVDDYDDWAGWFEGNVMINGDGFLPSMVAILSDANLKTNVEDLEDAGSIVAQLEPKTYDFLANDHPNLALPTTPQIGVIAQEVALILPELVREVDIPAMRDTLGNVVHPAETVKGLNYTGLIPVLIGAMKEQQATIAEQNARLDALEQDLAACCESGRVMQGTGGSNGTDQGDATNELRASDPTDQRLTITPNPFSEATVIGYTLPKSGMVSLQVSDATGKSLFNLFEGQQMEGTQRYDWNTSFLAPGTYHATLLVDGAPIIKKAVKVAR